MKSLRVVILTLALASAAAVASASTALPGIERREWRDEARIREGVRSGELTRGEVMRLRAGMRQIDRMEARARWDGRVTARERMAIADAQRRLDRQLHRFLNNDRVRDDRFDRDRYDRDHDMR